MQRAPEGHYVIGPGGGGVVVLYKVQAKAILILRSSH